MTKQTNPVIDVGNSEIQHPVAQESIVCAYPLELVAGIAAKVLSGTDYSKAAKIAMALLDACQKELSEQTHKREAVLAAEEKRRAIYTAVERDGDNKFVVKSFKEALKIITGKNREERAFPQYKRFLAYLMYTSRVLSKPSDVTEVTAPTDEEVEASIKDYKANGMRHDIVLRQREAFEIWEKKDASDIARQKALSKSPRAK